MPERTIKQALSYRDADGVMRYALAGETIDVAADDVKRFDKLNGGAPKEDTPAPKRQPPKKT